MAARALSLPTGRSGRMLAVALLVLLPLLVWSAMGAPLLGWYRDRAATLENRRAVAAHMAVLAERLPSLRRQAREAALSAGPSALMTGSSDAIAGAALQDRVQQMASSLGATLSSSETLAASDAGGKAAGGPYRRVGVRIAVTAPFNVMVKFIAAIEQASPVMLIDDLQLHGPRIQITADPPLECAMTILAFRHAGAGDSAAAHADVGAASDDAP
ncbi:type II secretion system protein GspM [Acetobacteraceae bacterium KSS8]|uniref:Type II secretion system protein GspM n=1 Tax=Endosaccharibacter trunci TaxID=2812733 RepID=A0ABT1W8V2_9PROT|nr:type II secretion system protein GspM [Acetobacteraceae bacterium KSS8]